ncbi:MAG: hypothetical protein JNM93_03005 [Bacteriovoracaceae bacterium]|nr:hypothetical protein [Bacteriovoracaceae bacterium]
MQVYYAPENYALELKKELALKKVKILHDHATLFVTDDVTDQTIYWKQDYGLDAQILHFNSVGDAVKLLKQYKVKWTHWSLTNHRRAELILSQINTPKAKIHDFPARADKTNYGCFSLVDQNTMIVSAQLQHPFPLGVVEFSATKEPPSRAYLKLWEFLSLSQASLSDIQNTLDVGSAPGGWTWVLADFSQKVFSVDKADLDASILKNKKVKYLNQSAFALKPEEIGPIDWFCSDIICYPDKLYQLVQNWMASSLVKNFVCTIKFQGETDFEAIEKFAAIPGSSVQHLYHNKHELTWSLQQK